MYIYNLPHEINIELCRLLDYNNDWKVLAGSHMKYKPFEVNEIEQRANRLALSPSSQLLLQWGQMNHSVEELFILLYYMDHVPAMRCLLPIVGEKFSLPLKKKDCFNKNRLTTAIDDNGYKNKMQRVGSNSIPVPVMLLEKSVRMPSSTSRVEYDESHVHSSSDPGKETSSDQEKTLVSMRTADINSEFLRSVAAIPLISYAELQVATGDWSPGNELGHGGFGSVFKGEYKLLPVAVKRLRGNDDKNRELIRELCLNQYRHDNILPLYGYSIGGPHPCLVYQLMAGGSLESRLKRKTGHPPLSWSQRYNIARGVASGLQYLHTMSGAPLIHGDIKPANILLDQCTMPKIGDFGLARKGPFGTDRSHVKVANVFGTPAYLPDEYIRSHHLCPAVDVFSYGVVLMEIATGLPVKDKTRPILLLHKYIRELQIQQQDISSLEDPVLRLTNNSDLRLYSVFMTIALHCTEEKRTHRPNMIDVYMKLNGLKQQ